MWNKTLKFVHFSTLVTFSTLFSLVFAIISPASVAAFLTLWPKATWCLTLEHWKRCSGILNLNFKRRLAVTFTISLFRGQNSIYASGREMHGPHNQSGHYGEKKASCPWLESNPESLGNPVKTYQLIHFLLATKLFVLDFALSLLYFEKFNSTSDGMLR